MALEIEAKMKVEDFARVLARLKELGASRIGEHLETNTFFDTEDRSLLAADEGLRLRRNHDVATGADEFVITYKGPRQPGALKSREEFELHVASEPEAIVLFERLGYDVVLRFEKRRQSWKLGECKVELDDVPYLGTFVEIEGPGETAVMRAREELGLGNAALVKASYVALLMNYLQEQGDASRVVGFPGNSMPPEAAKAG